MIFAPIPECFTNRRVESAFVLRERRHGFALVIALGLMSFIFLLLLGISTFVRVESHAVAQSLRSLEARQNAMLGIQIAFGELQLAAGPDQRVTAPAGMVIGTAAANKNWTGVWRAHSMQQGGGRASVFEGWLASLPQGDENVEDSIEEVPGIVLQQSTWVAEEDGWVVLVGEGSADLTDPGNAVVAANIPLSQGASVNGNFAWWVGDESVKSRVNLDYASNVPLAEIGIPPYTGLSLVSELGGISRESGDLRKLVNLTDLALLEGVPADVGKQHFHDLTLHARSLNVDVRRGGFKKDLTHILSHDTVFDREFGTSGEGYLLGTTSYDNAEDLGGSFPDGAPNWGILRDFFRLPDELTSSETIIPIAKIAYGNPGDHPNLGDHPYSGTYHENSPVHPVLSWFQVGISLQYLTRQEDGKTVYYPRLYIRPVFALYNPYDVRIESIEATGLKQYYQFELDYRPRITIQVGDRDPVVFGLQEVLPLHENASPRFRWRFNEIDFLPGETRYLALSNQVPVTVNAWMDKAYSESGAFIVNPTRDNHVRMPNNTGYTSTTNLNADNWNINSVYGLSQHERNLLEFVQESPSDPLPPLEVSVSHFTNDSHTTSVGSSMWLSPYLRGGRLYQDFGSDEEQVPKDTGPFEFETLAQVSSNDLISILGLGLRATGDTFLSHRQFIDANPRAFHFSTTMDGSVAGARLPVPTGWTMIGHEGVGVDPAPDIHDFDRFSGYFGASRHMADGSLGGSSSVVLFHVPRKPLTSLGLFQHANLGRAARHPAYMIGNSYALAGIATGATSELDARIFDWSYVINRELWDGYYFSTFPQNLSEELWDDWVEGREFFANPRLSVYIPEKYRSENTATLVDRVTNASEPLTPLRSLMFQVVEGAFNINSLSATAWKAFLASNTDLVIPVYDVASGLSSLHSEEETLFARTPIVFNQGAGTSALDESFWNSYRRLNESELDELAQAIVEEVRARGPFSSLADFVNRRLSGPLEQQRRGPLQAALDKSVNSNLSSLQVGSVAGSDLAIQDVIGGMYNPEDRSGTGAPGWILQGDVLQTLGPLMTVRSDTFRIRAYGDSVDPLTGSVKARAYCEAIVQRIPEPVGFAENGADEDLIFAAGDEGRQFRIIQFRWLSDDEV